MVVFTVLIANDGKQNTALNSQLFNVIAKGVG